MRRLQQTYLLILGRAALLSLSSVWSLKKMLRRLALSVSSEYMIPSCSRVGMEELVEFIMLKNTRIACLNHATIKSFHMNVLKNCPEVIQLFSCLTQLGMKF